MTLGEKMRQARLEAGLSQRQLCGAQITRNMLSQIENGSANPSVSTLQYLAQQLGKPLGYFLEEQALPPTSPPALQAALVQQWQADPEAAAGLAAQFPAWDEPLLLRCAAAAQAGDLSRARLLLSCVQVQDGPAWHYVCGLVAAAEGRWADARQSFLQAEDFNHTAVWQQLERCCREQEDYKAAYHYACRLRDGASE